MRGWVGRRGAGEWRGRRKWREGKEKWKEKICPSPHFPYLRPPSPRPLDTGNGRREASEGEKEAGSRAGKTRGGGSGGGRERKGVWVGE